MQEYLDTHVNDEPKHSLNWILREEMHRHVPKELMECPKMGFDIPIEHWLQGSLRDWAKALLDEK